MGNKARLKRIDQRTAGAEEILRQGNKTLALVAETNAELKAMVRESQAKREAAEKEARTNADRARADAERARADADRARADAERARAEAHAHAESARADAERHTQAIEDQRLAINQWNMRQEKMMREVLAATQEMIANIREWRYEGVEEARAQRAALWAILDELKGGGPATA